MNQVVGMPREPVELDDLLDTREQLFNGLPAALTESQRLFLLGLVRCEPDWKLMSCEHLQQLPAIRWKLRNLERLRDTNPAKFAEQHEELLRRLEAVG